MKRTKTYAELSKELRDNWNGFMAELAKSLHLDKFLDFLTRLIKKI